MAQSGFSSAWGAGDGGGGRRKKVYEYFKAANELRQTYAAQWAAQRNGGQRDFNEDYYRTPGAFPDVEIARSGDEEMVLFPSYARRLSEKNRPRYNVQRYEDDEESPYWNSPADSGSGRPEWEDYEDENTVVDVDVRGWIYAPHRGPMTRKHRLLIALARKLSGIPAPSNVSTEGGDASHEFGSAGKPSAKGEEEVVNNEAQRIISRAEREADPAWKGSSSTNRDDRPPTANLSRSTTTQSTSMNKDELSIANAHLMERLRPFLTNPMAEMPVTVFFFNDEKSQSRNIMTDESGHFSLRAALPFVPTHIRVLASEDLSAAKEIRIIEPTGVSLISDIDDTVKHSAIASGAKEIFRNTFIRELAELNVDGVTDWYKKVAAKGVEIHYVSNSPWQLYPLLESYFKMIGLPPGSFHLKQYSGMLQGIFEPTAERKKAPLERILRDFPDRKFILVGDSGEADLEVYTDIALANPGRILGVFIRDVTTPEPKKFFEKSVDHLESVASRSRSIDQIADRSDVLEDRPALPPRRRQPSAPDTDAHSLDNGDLIDLRDNDDDDDQQSCPTAETTKPVASRQPPAKPCKPSSLRTVTSSSDPTDSKEASSPSQYQGMIRRKPIPPLPPRRQSTPRTGSPADRVQSAPADQQQSSARGPSVSADDQNGTSTSMAANTTSSASNRSKPSSTNTSGSLQADPRAKQPPPPLPPPRRSNTGASTASSTTTTSTPTSTPNRPLPIPKQQSYPAAAAAAAYQFASERLNWSSSSPASSLKSFSSNPNLARANNSMPASDQDSISSAPPPAAPLPNKREELWRRRWDRAKEILDQHGIVLASWRVGSDVEDVCLWLVDDAMKDIQGGEKQPVASRR